MLTNVLTKPGINGPDHGVDIKNAKSNGESKEQGKALDYSSTSQQQSSNKPKHPRSVRRVAMDCLARREHSFFELKQKLQLKLPEISPEEIQGELERLREQNLQSDKRFVESYVRYRKSKSFGYLHIREDLRRRFVAEALINQTLFEDDQDWLSMILELVAKRFPHNRVVEFGSKDHLRVERFLRARGFQSNLVRKVLDNLIS